MVRLICERRSRLGGRTLDRSKTVLAEDHETHVTKRAQADLEPEPTQYRNVDLDVYGKVPLDGFV
jgi:hypothetical protein